MFKAKKSAWTGSKAILMFCWLFPGLSAQHVLTLDSQLQLDFSLFELFWKKNKFIQYKNMSNSAKHRWKMEKKHFLKVINYFI